MFIRLQCSTSAGGGLSLMSADGRFSEWLVKIQAVTFDVGGTLLEPCPSVGEVYCRIAREFGFGQIPAATVTEQFLTAWRARGVFGYTRGEWRQLVEESLSGFCAVSDELFKAIYEGFAQRESWRVFEDVFPTLHALRGGGLKLGVISNWDERLRPLLDAVGLAESFDVTVVSTEVGAHKPDREIFDAASRALQLPGGAILHVGDSRREDLEGAIAAGFHAFRISRNSPTPRSETEIASLLEIPGRIL
jgi:putative hydrolase of the HAD superfamily